MSAAEGHVGSGPGDLLLTDLYQLTMMQTYLERGMTAPASFELFVRRLPPGRGFLLAAGLAQALEFLASLRCSSQELEWLLGCGRFSRAFVLGLEQLSFTGDVHAMPEGTPFFADEPILRVTAPLPLAQLVETRLVNLLHFQTLVASKAARIVLAAAGRATIEFGLRRAHGAEAGLHAARASFLAGMDGSSNVLAAMRFGVPPYGTMAHSFVQAHAHEGEAFEHFADSHPDNVVLLVDTYDTEAGAHEVVALARRRPDIRIQAVRLDSGDLDTLARRVREILDAGGLGTTRILASGGLDEVEIERLVAAGAPIDSFAPGTKLDTSADAPYLDCAYKLVEYAGTPRMKLSVGKATWPGRKQVYRTVGHDGRLAGDVLTLADAPASGGEPLLHQVMARGRPTATAPSLVDLRRRAASELARLPEPLRRREDMAYPVTIAEELRTVAAATRRSSG